MINYSICQEKNLDYRKILTMLLMIDSYDFNKRIYNSKFSFEPIIGETYFLYLDKQGSDFLSLIPPTQCRFEYLATCTIGPDKIWIKRD